MEKKIETTKLKEGIYWDILGLLDRIILLSETGKDNGSHVIEALRFRAE